MSLNITLLLITPQISFLKETPKSHLPQIPSDFYSSILSRLNIMHWQWHPALYSSMYCLSGEHRTRLNHNLSSEMTVNTNYLIPNLLQTAVSDFFFTIPEQGADPLLFRLTHSRKVYWKHQQCCLNPYLLKPVAKFPFSSVVEDHAFRVQIQFKSNKGRADISLTLILGHQSVLQLGKVKYFS